MGGLNVVVGQMPEDCKVMTHAEWIEKGTELFGNDQMQWQFVCPSCGHVASIQDWKNAGARITQAAFSCVGRFMSSPKSLGQKPGPCDYAGGGLIGLNPVTVIFSDGDKVNVFDFWEGQNG
jgi:hypothetical protein